MHRNQLCLLTSRRCLGGIVVCGLMLIGGTSVLAQTGGLGGGTGGLGGTGSLGGGQSGGGLTGSGQSGTGQSGTGTQSGGLTGPQLLQFGADVDTTGGTGFAGGGNAGQNFVGGLVQSTTQTANAGGLNNQFAAINRRGQFNNRNAQPTGPSRSQLLRPRHRVAFNYTRRQTPTITGNLQTWLRTIPNNNASSTNVTGVNISLNNDGVATLSGSVADSHSAKLAAALARIEPGIRSVDSKLTIAGEPPKLP